ncbi:hypothetical protein ACNKHW_07630 [Shigella flexneri]
MWEEEQVTSWPIKAVIILLLTQHEHHFTSVAELHELRWVTRGFFACGERSNSIEFPEVGFL